MTRGQIPPSVLRGVIDDAHLADMDLRNRQRAAEIIERLGPKYACWNPNPPRKAKESQ